VDEIVGKRPDAGLCLESDVSQHSGCWAAAVTQNEDVMRARHSVTSSSSPPFLLSSLSLSCYYMIEPLDPMLQKRH
jgi:hypothetical protein